MRALRRAAPAGAASAGALLLQAMPAGRLARAAEGPPSLPAAEPSRDLLVVRRSVARRPASGGAVLLKAVPAGVLPARPQAAPQLAEDLGPARHVARSAGTNGKRKEPAWLTETTTRSRTLFARARDRAQRYSVWLEHLRGGDPVFAEASALCPPDMSEWQSAVCLLTGNDGVWGEARRPGHARALDWVGDRGARAPRAGRWRRARTP